MEMDSSESASSESGPLKIYFLPYLSPGHIIPLSEMARLFAARDQHVTIITTPSNSLLLHSFISQDAAAGRPIHLHTIPFPSAAVGLPAGVENFFSATDLDTAAKLYKGLTLMQSHIESFVLSHPPDVIVADMFFPWTTALAARLNIPRLVFHSACIFAMCMKDSMRRRYRRRHGVSGDGDDYRPFLVPDLPDPIFITRAQLPDYVRTPNGYTELMETWREAELKSYGVLVNNFEEVEMEYIQLYKRIMGHTVWHIGPAPLILKSAEEKLKRSHHTAADTAECLRWLDSKELDSVLYICFGSACRFPDDQLFELACALEASGHRFVWVVFGKEEEEEEEERRKWMPEGFEERMKAGDKGMIVRGWAPQVLILDHPATGGFMTHCGWNSTVEGICAGIPMITWPLYAEQFYNEKLITQVLKIGVEAGVEEWNLWVHAGKKVVKRESIENAVKKLMAGGEEATERRRRAREMGTAAKIATRQGGSSHNNLTLLIEELKKMRKSRK